MVSNSGSLIGADVARASQGGDVVWNPSGRVTVAVLYRIPPGVSTTVRSVVTWDENEGRVASAWTRCQEAQYTSQKTWIKTSMLSTSMMIFDEEHKYLEVVFGE